MSSACDDYASFLLRFQRVKRDSEERTWTARIQSTETGELYWFPDVEVLIRFLRDEFGVERTGG